jgi:hypothetical protein
MDKQLTQLKKDMRMGLISDAVYFDGLIELGKIDDAHKELAQMKRNGLISDASARAVQRKIELIAPKV